MVDQNIRETRRAVLKSLIKQLHEGRSVADVRAEFARHFSTVSALEISQLEQELVQEGLPITEIQRLCDVHADLFKGSIEQIHTPADSSQIPGHPLQVFNRENRQLEKVIQTELEPLLTHTHDQTDVRERLILALERLARIDLHYSRNENLLFPYLEQKGITAPPKVMWAVDDEIRELIKTALAAVKVWPDSVRLPQEITDKVQVACQQVNEMIFKEENILFPLAQKTLQEKDWISIAQESAEIGYTLLDPAELAIWQPAALGKLPTEPKEGMIQLPSGQLSLEELTRILDTLPFDITFVDAADTVRYFSQSNERIFPRTKTVLGRAVVNCHPPASMHVVEKILADFKAGQRDTADFWLHLGQRYVLIGYFAVRSAENKFLGTLEVSQDIAPLQAIEGEKKLLD